MFTDQEIRTAMDGLVKQKGEGHTSYGRYADPITGKGACFLGALCEFMGMKVPSEGTSARNVLGVEVSPAMAAAFQVAQNLNDQHMEWKYVLLGVDLVLAAGPQAKYRNGACPCGCDSYMDFSPIFDEVNRQRALDMARRPKAPIKRYATGGIIDLDQIPQSLSIKGLTVTSVSNSLGSITYNVTGAAASVTQFTQAFASAGLAQKDHALTA